MGFDLNGNVAAVVQKHVDDRMNNSQLWTSWVDYNGTTLEVRLNETGSRPASPFLQLNVDLASVLGSADAFVGFTSGTGGAYGNHDIVIWTFDSEYNPFGSVPETGMTLTLLSLSCSALAFFGRRPRARA